MSEREDLLEHAEYWGRGAQRYAELAEQEIDRLEAEIERLKKMHETRNCERAVIDSCDTDSIQKGITAMNGHGTGK